MINKKFKLFSCCVTTRGANRAVIVDFQREAFHFFSNSIIDLLDEYSNKSIYNLFKDFENDKLILKKYIRYFLDNELILITEESDNFPSISNDFIRPFELDTLTIELALLKTNEALFFKIEIDKLGVTCLRLICEDTTSGDLEKLLTYIKKSKINSVVLFVKYNKNILGKIAKISSENPIITQVVYYDYDGKNIADKKIITNHNFFSFPIEIVLSMRVSSLRDFVLNMTFFSESLHFNSTYNRTVYIDKLGYIKRYINDNCIFGNIENANLDEVISTSKFKEFWAISRDKIKVCSDCEFRYICSDGNIPYKENETDLYYSKKIKCNYDPYQIKWDDNKNN